VSRLAAWILAAGLAGCTVPAPRGPAVPSAPTSPATASPATRAPDALAGPRFAPGGPDAEEYGAGRGYPTGAVTYFRLPFAVGSFSHLDEVFEGRVVRRAAAPSPLGRAAAEPALHYVFGGQPYTIDEYLARNPATGLLIAKGDTILVERYQYARHDRHRFTSWSMAKTVTAMLIGIAIAEGRIRSVDDPAAAYVPALAGTEYGRTSLRHLLQMSSGVRFGETYRGWDDTARLVAETYFQLGAGGVDSVKAYNERVQPAGTRFAYASTETQVLGLALRSAVGRPLADYLREKIWEPMGAEADATWLVDRSGQEAAFCCLNAVLRDYARLGLLLAHGGTWRGREIIPAAWIEAATRVAPDQDHLLPGLATSFFGYGYQVWIFPGARRMFALLGAHGQAIYVDAASRLVMVHTAVRKQRAFDPGEREALALWRGLVRELAD
jgi:CubicO group peptidase (beta-lactamase class C family)